ncbi:MAG: hypothetical protein GY851_10575 [bacterium]|nr:hypothetical protein [bacterium]
MATAPAYQDSTKKSPYESETIPTHKIAPEQANRRVPKPAKSAPWPGGKK